MPDLQHSLQGRDLSHLRILAERWGLELNAPDFRRSLAALVDGILNQELVDEITAALAPEAQDALNELLQLDGRMPWRQFTRKYGEIRKMGAARRDRERPDRNPASPAETLFYHGLVATAFFEDADGLNEYAYIPDDLVLLLPEKHSKNPAPLGRPASPGEKKENIPRNDTIIDQATTLLAAIRLGIYPETPREDASPFDETDTSPEVIQALPILLQAAGLLNQNQEIDPEQTRSFLEKTRGEALAMLVQAWLDSEIFDELRLLPGLRAEGEWVSQPRRTRRAVLDFISSIPTGTWWSLNAFIAAIKERTPDYQRPAGNYDGYHLVDEVSGEFIQGFENWDRVDGALLSYFITGPLHWFGIAHLAASEPSSTPVTAFQITRWMTSLLQGKPPENSQKEMEAVHVWSDGQIRIPRLAPRSARYHISRFTRWLPPGQEEYRYRLTPSSLLRAQEQGLRVDHLITLLARYSDGNIPPNITAALRRWEKNGQEVVIEQLIVLSVTNPEALQALRNSRAQRFLLYPLSPVKVVLRAGAENKVLEALTELGYLGEIVTPLSDDRS